jgi:hypothetical protein
MAEARINTHASIAVQRFRSLHRRAVAIGNAMQRLAARSPMLY